jgi:hypothetical protein
MLLRHENWNPWLGIPTHETGLVPWLSPAVIYALAFFTGWLVFGRRSVLELWQQHWQWYVAFAAILSALCIGLIGTEPSLTDFDYFNGSRLTLVIYALCYATALWCWCFGLTGLALRYCSAPNPTVRYLADASYWLYLMHLPLIFTLQVLLMNVPLHWLIKYPLILIITLWLLLLTYQRWVRATWLGQLLNGRRQ